MEADYPHTNAVIGDEGEGEHNHQGEKKSVLKKVKDKAKKIKDTIKKHGGGHGNDHDEEEDDDDEETVNVSEVHGAPLHESGFISGTNLPKQTGLDLEKPAGPPEDLNPTAKLYPPDFGDDRGSTKTAVEYDYGGTGDAVVGMYDRSLRNEPYGSDATEVTDNPGVWEMYDSKDKTTKIPDLQHEHHNSSIRDETGMEKFDFPNDPQVQNRFPMSTNAVDLNDSSVAEPRVKIGPLEDLEEDPHRPKIHPEDIHPSNYQTKVVDPTGKGGKEADVSPLIQRLGGLQVSDESESEKQSPSTGSHNQFAPQSTPTIDEFNPESPKTLDPARPESMPRDTIAGKISSATSAIADKAVSAKNAVASKLGYGEAGTNYGAAAAADGGSVAGESDKGVSVREYLSEKLSPGEEDRALSEAITDAIYKRKGYNYKPEDSGPERDPSDENTGSGPGVVGRVKGAVSSWLGMSGSAQNVGEDQSEGDFHAGEGATRTQGVGGGLH